MRGGFGGGGLLVGIGLSLADLRIRGALVLTKSPLDANLRWFCWGIRLVFPINDSYLWGPAPLGLKLDQSLLVHLTEDSPLLTARDTQLEALLVGD